MRDFCGNPTTFGVQLRVDRHEAFLKWLGYHVTIVVPFRYSSNESNNIDAVKEE